MASGKLFDLSCIHYKNLQFSFSQ